MMTVSIHIHRDAFVDAAPKPQNKKIVIYADGTTLYVSPEQARRLSC